ncbi:hypothetical protein, partial [uncultured Duncaniella sp.]
MATVKKRKKKGNESWLTRHSLGVMTAVIAIIVAIGAVFAFAFIPYTGGNDKEGDWVYIPHGASTAQVRDSLKNSLGSSMGTRIYIMW